MLGLLLQNFFHEMLLHDILWKLFVAKVFSYTVRKSKRDSTAEKTVERDEKEIERFEE